MAVLDPLSWSAPADPADRKDYTLMWNLVLGADTITDSQWRLDASAVAAGVEIHQDDFADTTASVWFKVAEPQQEDAAFSNQGLLVMATNTITTAAGRIHERSVTVTFRQR